MNPSRAISADNQLAAEQRLLVPRDFLSIWARNRETGDAAFVGFWSDIIGPLTANVIDPDTGLPVSRPFLGFGKDLIQIDDIPQVAAIQIQQVAIRLSQIGDIVTLAVRQYDTRQCRVQIHRGLFHPGGRVMVSAAECRFDGFSDELDITTPAEGEDGICTMLCVSHTREMTRANPDTRSHESQIKRHPGDNFLINAATIGDRDIRWGRAGGKLDTAGSSGSSSGPTGNTPAGGSRSGGTGFSRPVSGGRR